MEESSIIALIQASDGRTAATVQASEGRIIAAIERARSESRADLIAHQEHDDKRFDALRGRASWPPRGKGWAAILAAVLGSGGSGYLLHHCQGSVAIVPGSGQTTGEVRR